MTDKSLSIIFPKDNNKANLTVHGVFAYPEEWKTTDQANPDMFTYVVRMGGLQVVGGKIHPRQLTQKQLNQQQQAKKKGGKKQAKKQENPAELEKLKQQQEKQEQEERRKQQQWNKLSEEQKFHSASEDSFKSALLKFGAQTCEGQLKSKNLVVFEERVFKDKGDWIYVYKMPTANEEQLAKLKKGKPKNLNLNDLNPICMRAWVDFSELNSQDNCQISQRCNLVQIDKTQETPEPNLEKTYIKLTLKLDQPLVSKKDKYSINTIISDPPKTKQLPQAQKCVKQIKQQLRLALQSLAMQYSTMFWKDLNFQQQQKVSNIFLNYRKNEHTKRKQQFLYDFNVSGKYKILKQRLKKNIVHICQHKYSEKMQGLKSFTGITCSVRDQFYSQIYNFLVSTYSQTVNQLIAQMRQKLGDVQVLNKASRKKLTQEHLQSYKTQSNKERLSRIIAQYQLINNYQYGQYLYKKMIQENPDNNLQYKYQYAIYCIKNGLKNIANNPQILVSVDQYLQYKKNQNKQYIVMYALLLLQSGVTQNINKSWVLLRQLIEGQQTNLQYLLYAILALQMLNKNQLAQKYAHKAYRQQLRNSGKLGEVCQHKENPHISQIPSLASVASFIQQLAAEEIDKLWIQILQNIQKLGLLNTLQKCSQKIADKQSNINFKKINLKIQLRKKNFQKALEVTTRLYEQTKQISLLDNLIIAQLALHKYQEAQKNFKILLRKSDGAQRISLLFQLGNLYTKQQKFGNSKACLLKYLQAAKQCCGGLSWQMLGNCQNKIGQYQSAINCFRHANLNDPYNKETWILLAEAYAKCGNFVMVNQCWKSYKYGETGNKDIKKQNMSASMNLKKQSQVDKQGKNENKGEQRQQNQEPPKVNTVQQIVKCLQNSEPLNFYDETMRDTLVNRLQAQIQINS